MELKAAKINQLEEIKNIYKKIIINMNNNNINIWDEIYPCEFFEDDIKNKKLYILIDKNAIIGAFVLSENHEGANAVIWTQPNEKSFFIDRLGINVDYLRKGYGEIILKYAFDLAKNKGGKFLKLYVVTHNKPAINLYLKAGFKRAHGIYREKLDHNTILSQFGFEKKL